MLYESMLVIAILALATFLFRLGFGDATEGMKRHVLQLYLWLTTAIYFIWCWLRGGQTLAMQTWRIRLLHISGQPLSLSLAVERYVLASIGLMFFAAGFLWAFFDRDGQFLHDRLTGCRIVQEPRPAP